MKAKYLITCLAMLALPNFALAKASEQPATSGGTSAALITLGAAGKNSKILGRDNSGAQTLAKDDDKDDDKE